MMCKIVGNKILFIILVLFSAFLHAEIKLTLRDIDGNRTKDAVIGKPFLLDVHMQSHGGTMRYPIIDGLEEFTAHKSGFQLNTINGASTAIYTYQVRIDKPGDYTLGPAHSQTSQGIEKSNTVIISVGKNNDAQKNSNILRTQNAFLRLTANKSSVFVGESVSCLLRFYYTSNRTNIRSIGGPDEQKIAGVTFYQQRGPVQGHEEVDGIPYDYVEWHWNITPTQSGNIVIPAYFVDYHIEKRNASNRFAGLLGFFGHRIKEKRTYSNALTLTVQELPPTDKKISGVGVIKKFWSQLKPPTAKQGEGMVLTLGVQGDIDLSSLDINQLEGMPTSFKWYESKQYISGDTKLFEFIIQGLEPGDWQISPQQLVYFDVATKKYKTIQTNMLAVNIVKDDAFDTAATVSAQTSIDVSNKTDLQPLDYSDVWYKVQEKAIPWPWFIGILLLAFLIWSIFFLKAFLRGDGHTIEKKYAFAYAREQLKKLVENGDVASLYSIFMYVIAVRTGTAKTALSESVIRTLLQNAQFSRDEVSEWQRFFASMQSYAFSSQKTQDDIFEHAKKWLDILEKRL